uniref:Uncharacterized protein n=1 Tax=Laticauda laticaudata TaxID=8630 RepID=A0A8C5RS07_LATLA
INGIACLQKLWVLQHWKSSRGDWISIVWDGIRSPALRDQIVSATIYFDNVHSGEVSELLKNVGHHTVGLRLQRKGDRSPLPGQSGSYDMFPPRSPEVVLVSKCEKRDRTAICLKWNRVSCLREGTGQEDLQGPLQLLSFCYCSHSIISESIRDLV